MGAFSAWILKIEDAGRLISGRAGTRARVDVRDPQDARVSRRIEIGIEHAAA